jgi:mRNA (guanine-N7-)-methyltransferase
MSLRKFHNQIKGELLSLGANGTLFDIGVGKGGDLHKWVNYGFTRVRGVDVNPRSLDEARKRTAEKERELFRQLDYQYALTGASAVDSNLPPEKFDMVSCQFAIHYFFKDWDSIDRFLDAVVRRLKTGGYFVCTAMDGSRVGNLPLESEYISIHSTDESHKINVNMRHTPYFQSSFIEEYVVLPNTLIGACEEHGLEFVDMKPFSSYERKLRAGLNEGEKRASFLYNSYTFRKH